MQYKARMPFLFRIVFTLLAAAALDAARAAPGDLLAERIPGSYSGPEWPGSGTTAGMSAEPGEINEAAAPSGTLDRSVWYEYAPYYDDLTAFLQVAFSGSSARKGFAAYVVPAATPVTMTALRPAGACLGAPAHQTLQLRVFFKRGELLILRIWTAPADEAPDDPGAAFQLVRSFQRTNAPSPVTSRGDVVDYPNRFYSTAIEDTHAQYLGGRFGFSPRYASSVEETLIGSHWYPAAAVSWFEWQAPYSGRFRLSLAGKHMALGSLLVTQMTGGAFDYITPPGTSVTFEALAGSKYLIRLGDSGLMYAEDMRVHLTVGPAEPGDEPGSAVPLTPGVPAKVRIAGASPSSPPLPAPPAPAVPYPPEPTTEPNLPDVWFDLGTVLEGSWRVDGGGGLVTIYRADSAGIPLGTVAGGPESEGAAFYAETGTRYLARLSWRELSNQPPVWRVSLEPGAPPPVHDRRAGAIILNIDTLPVVIRGNAAGATAEESDWSASDHVPYGGSVWYALDQPASPHPWFVYAWNHAVLPLGVFREENGVLVSARMNPPLGDPSRFTLHGGRTWIMVRANADSRFMLMTGPTISPGDQFASPVPITPGVREFHYPGAATAEPGEPTDAAWSVWHTWTAKETGLVHFSTRGSASPRRTRIFTGSELAALVEVPVTTYNGTYIEDGQRVESFQAKAGTTYRLQTNPFGLPPFAPYATILKPGGWDSPYDVWRQNWPAWEDVPSLADPLADTDGDGLANVMEMALLGIRGMVLPDPPTFPWLYFPDEGTPRLEVFWGERSWALRGPAGCTPFHLTGEASTDFTSWTAVHEPSPPTAVEDYNHHLMLPRPGEAPARFFRLRVHR
jgi:hypothetical protein